MNLEIGSEVTFNYHRFDYFPTQVFMFDTHKQVGQRKYLIPYCGFTYSYVIIIEIISEFATPFVISRSKPPAADHQS